MAAMVVAPKASRLERNTMASCFSASHISTRRNSTGSSPSRFSRGKADDLVAHHVAVLWNLQFFFHLVNRLLLHPRHEVHFLLRQSPKPLVVVVAAVNGQDRPRSEPRSEEHTSELQSLRHLV